MSESVVEQEKKLFTYKGDDRVVSFREMREELKQEPEGFIIHSYFSHLESLIEGFKEGELILLSGKPKSGKTLILQTFTSHFALQKRRVLWFSYEVPARQFLDSFPALPEGYMPRQLELGNIWWLKEKIHESILKYNTRIIMIDHIHYLIDMTRIQNPSLEIGAIYRQLKLLAIKYRIVIFLISHLRKVDKGIEPQGEDIRDTNLALGEPDTILMLWRVADEDGEIGNKAILKVIASRRTGVMEKKIYLRKEEMGYLEEVE